MDSKMYTILENTTYFATFLKKIYNEETFP